jgi:hypothetical protein
MCSKYIYFFQEICSFTALTIAAFCDERPAVWCACLWLLRVLSQTDSCCLSVWDRKSSPPIRIIDRRLSGCNISPTQSVNTLRKAPAVMHTTFIWTASWILEAVYIKSQLVLLYLRVFHTASWGGRSVNALIDVFSLYSFVSPIYYSRDNYAPVTTIVALT